MVIFLVHAVQVILVKIIDYCISELIIMKELSNIKVTIDGFIFVAVKFAFCSLNITYQDWGHKDVYGGLDLEKTYTQHRTIK